MTTGRAWAIPGAWWIAGGLAAVTFVLSLVVGHAFFANLSIDNDDAVYVLEAKAFANGQLTLSDSAHGDAFRPWMSGRVEGDRLVLVEQPVLPALMAASSKVFGTMRVAVALVGAGAVLAVFALARQLLDDDRVALVAAGAFVLSPLVIVQSAMYVSYVLAVALAATTLTLLTRGLDRRADGDGAGAVGWFLGAGLAHGVLLFTRPLEGIVLGLIELVWLAVRRVDRRTLLTVVGAMAVGAVPVLAATLLYNELTTGSPLRFALWTIGGDDSFGFGPRSVAEHAMVIDVGPSESFLALRTNLRAFPHWFVGGLVSVPLAAWGAWTLWHRSRRVLSLLVTMLVAYPVAYFFYYGNYLIIGGRNYYGPHYYLGLLAPSAILLAVGLVDLFGRRRAWGWVAVALVVVGTAVEVPDKVRRNADVADDLAADRRAVDDVVVDPAVVIVPAGVDGPYVLHPRGGLGNPPDLDAPTLFAADLGGRNLELADRFPDRRLYRFQQVATADGSAPEVAPLEVRRGSQVELGVDTRPSPEHPAQVAYVQVGDQRATCDPAGPATGPVTVRLEPGRATVQGCEGAGALPLDGATTVTFGVTSPGTPAAAGDGRGDAVDTVELRYWVRSGPDGVAALVPGELWERHGAGATFRVVDPALVPWVVPATP